MLIEYTFSVLYSETFTFYLLRFLREYSLSVTFPLIESRFFQISLQLWFILYQQHFFSSFIKSISKRRHMSNITIFPSTFYCNHLLPIDKFFREIFSGSCHIPTFFWDISYFQTKVKLLLLILSNYIHAFCFCFVFLTEVLTISKYPRFFISFTWMYRWLLQIFQISVSSHYLTNVISYNRTLLCSLMP